MSDSTVVPKRTALWVLYSLLALGLCLCSCLFIWPVGGNTRQTAQWAACMSNIKQQLTAVQIYAQDFEDHVPPHYSFNGPSDVEAYQKSLLPYGKNPESWDLGICPSVSTILTEKSGTVVVEPVYPKFMYTHCLSLKGIIPKYAEGGRNLSLKATPFDPATTPYLRDVLVSDNPKGRSDKLISAHGERFNIGYLDGHAHKKYPLDPAKDL